MNPNNLCLRFEYQTHLKEAEGRDPKTIDLALAAIAEFDEVIGHRDYLKLRSEDSVRYKEWLLVRLSKADGAPLAKTTILHRLAFIRSYLAWVKTRKGFSAIDGDTIEFLNPSRRLELNARQRKSRVGPSPQVVTDLILSMPSESFSERRDRAVLALIYLTGARDGVIPGLRFRHIDIGGGVLDQNGDEVATKFGKHLKTFFFPVDERVRTIVVDWVLELERSKWDPEWPLFPASPNPILQVSAGKRTAPQPWSTARPVRRILSHVCDLSGTPRFPPHHIRKTLMQLGMEKCTSLKAMKAWSQNLGHERIETTDINYGTLDPLEVGALINSKPKTGLEEIVALLESANEESLAALKFIIGQMSQASMRP
jgi:integrase